MLTNISSLITLCLYIWQSLKSDIIVDTCPCTPVTSVALMRKGSLAFSRKLFPWQADIRRIMFSIQDSVFLLDLPDIIAYPWKFPLTSYGGTQVSSLGECCNMISLAIIKKYIYRVSHWLSLDKPFSNPSTLPLLVIFATLYFTADLSRHELKLKADTSIASACNSS